MKEELEVQQEVKPEIKTAPSFVPAALRRKPMAANVASKPEPAKPEVIRPESAKPSAAEQSVTAPAKSSVLTALAQYASASDSEQEPPKQQPPTVAQMSQGKIQISTAKKWGQPKPVSQLESDVLNFLKDLN